MYSNFDNQWTEGLVFFDQLSIYIMIWGGIAVVAMVLTYWLKLDKKIKSKAKVIRRNGGND